MTKVELEAYIDGHLTLLSMAFALLTQSLPEQRYANLRDKIADIGTNFAEQASLLNIPSAAIEHGENQSFFLGISQRTETLLEMMAALRTSSP